MRVPSTKYILSSVNQIQDDFPHPKYDGFTRIRVLVGFKLVCFVNVGVSIVYYGVVMLDISYVRLCPISFNPIELHICVNRNT